MLSVSFRGAHAELHGLAHPGPHTYPRVTVPRDVLPGVAAEQALVDDLGHPPDVGLGGAGSVVLGPFYADFSCSPGAFGSVFSNAGSNVLPHSGQGEPVWLRRS